MYEDLALFRRYPRLLVYLPWVSLGKWPTPVQRMSKLEQRFDLPAFYVKRDDMSSDVYGGNKVRKLEFSLADALYKGCTRVMTVGAAGSNHVLATAVHGRRLGIRTTALLFDQPCALYVRRNLLMDHLENKKQVELENILRVLAIQDRSGQMRIGWRGIFSANARQRSNSVEVLDDLMDPSLSRIMLQLLEGLPPDETLKAGRKHFQLPRFDSGREAICSHFLTQHNEWVTLVLALNLIWEQGLDGMDRGLVQQLEHAENVFVRQMARPATYGGP